MQLKSSTFSTMVVPMEIQPFYDPIVSINPKKYIKRQKIFWLSSKNKNKHNLVVKHKRTSSSSAPNAYNCSIAAIIVCTGGASMKSKLIKSLTPIAFSDNTVVARLVRCISGTAVGTISFLYALSVYKR